LLARLMGAQQYGTYAYILSWVTILLIPALFGMDTLLVRQVAIIAALRTSWAGSQQASTFWTALALLPLLAMLRVQNGVMRGLRAVVRGRVPELVIFTGALVMMVVVATYLFGIAITPVLAFALMIGCAAIALAVSTGWTRDLVPDAVRRAGAELEVKVWLRSALPLVLMTGMVAINTRLEILMVGTMLDHRAAGVYAVASQLSSLVAFVLVAVNSALAPAIAHFRSTAEEARLQSVVTKSTRFVLASAMPVALALVLFGYWLLLLFGSAFTVGLLPLRLLVLGQIVNVMAGSVGWLLIMTGHERDAAVGVGVGAVVNVGLDAVLIRVRGAAGTAAATAISMACWNILLAYFVFKCLGIYSFAFANANPDVPDN
jgi:O-antigen/teichoic acid export membrane protein